MRNKEQKLEAITDEWLIILAYNLIRAPIYYENNYFCDLCMCGIYKYHPVLPKLLPISLLCL
jgi:hypothetical protein